MDDIAPLEATVDALRALPIRPTARVVFDQGQPPAYYAAALGAIHRVSDVMGELLDSQFVANISVDGYAARARAYLDSVDENVDIWEIGNEVNGEWLGSTPDVVAKISAAYYEVKSRGRVAAITLHYNVGCGAPREKDVFGWSQRSLPASMREGIDYVFLSYYEDDCDGREPNWPSAFHELAALFPRAALGIGECGTAHAAKKAEVMRRYYQMHIAEPRFVGGFFWWYFSKDMVPRAQPMWATFDKLMRAR